MTALSDDLKQALEELRVIVAEEHALENPDTAWTDDLPSDPLPDEGEETSVTFLTKPK